MANEALVDTTVLTDVLLKDSSPQGKAAKKALARYGETLLPVYAIKEFRAGPLKAHIWFFNHLAASRSIVKTVDALQRMSLSPRRYTVSTALEALKAAAQAPATIGRLVAEYGPNASVDVVQADRYRLNEGRRIRRAWKNRRAFTSRVIEELSCFDEDSFKQTDDGLFNVDPPGCRRGAKCCLVKRFGSELRGVKQLRSVLEKSDLNRAENKRRNTALKQLLNASDRFTQSNCRGLGDAYFALISPPGAVILTTNDRDHTPLAAALGKAVEKP